MAHTAAGGLQQLFFVEFPITIGVTQSVEGLGVIGIGIQRAVGIQQTAALAQCVIDGF